MKLAYRAWDIERIHAIDRERDRCRPVLAVHDLAGGGHRQRGGELQLTGVFVMYWERNMKNRKMTKLVAFAAAFAGFLALSYSSDAVAQAATDVICVQCVDTTDIKKNSIPYNRLKKNSVRTNKIAAGAVTFEKLHNSARGIGSNGFITIPASQFNSSSDNNDYYISFSGGHLRNDIASTLLCYVAPVLLPFGVTVTSLEGFVVDNSTSVGFSSFNLRRKTVTSTASAVTMASTATTSNADSSASVVTLADSSIADAVVDNADYAYSIDVCITSDSDVQLMKIFGARITYN